MGKIQKLLNSYGKYESDQYKKGWRDAVSHVNDLYFLKKRDGKEEFDFTINLELDDEIIKKIKRNEKK